MVSSIFVKIVFQKLRQGSIPACGSVFSLFFFFSRVAPARSNFNSSWVTSQFLCSIRMFVTVSTLPYPCVDLSGERH
jgi:hypothetical protein